MPLTVGGGVRTADDVRALLHAGADKVSVNTAALARPEMIDECARGVRLAMHRPGRGRQARAARPPPATADTRCPRGGRFTRTADAAPTGRDVLDWAREAVARGAGEILLTSMDADGTKDGYDIELTAAVSAAVGVPVIASGGAGKLEHLADVLTRGRADAVLAASIFHFGEYDIAAVKRFLAARGIPVRPPGKRNGPLTRRKIAPAARKDGTSAAKGYRRVRSIIIPAVVPVVIPPVIVMVVDGGNSDGGGRLRRRR